MWTNPQLFAILLTWDNAVSKMCLNRSQVSSGMIDSTKEFRLKRDLFDANSTLPTPWASIMKNETDIDSVRFHRVKRFYQKIYVLIRFARWCLPIVRGGCSRHLFLWRISLLIKFRVKNALSTPNGALISQSHGYYALAFMGIVLSGS